MVTSVSTAALNTTLRNEGMRFTHRLILRRYRIPSDFVLNSGPEPVAADLQRIMNAMKAEAYDLIKKGKARRDKFRDRGGDKACFEGSEYKSL